MQINVIKICISWFINEMQNYLFIIIHDKTRILLVFT